MKKILASNILIVSFFYIFFGLYSAQTIIEPTPPKGTVTIEEIPTISSIDPKELECLTKNIYFEAGNQDIKGKIAVATITLNRVKHSKYPDTICGVIKDAKFRFGKLIINKCQFSWYCDGKSDEPRLTNLKEQLTWGDSQFVARSMLEGMIHKPDNIADATHYHADYVSPRWSKHPRVAFKTKIGNHLFYKETFNY